MIAGRSDRQVSVLLARARLVLGDDDGRFAVLTVLMMVLTGAGM